MPARLEESISGLNRITYTAGVNARPRDSKNYADVKIVWINPRIYCNDGAQYRVVYIAIPDVMIPNMDGWH